MLLSLFFSRQATGAGAQVLLILGLVALAVALATGVRRVERTMRLTPVLRRLQDTSAQIRVRGALLLLLVFVALAERLGLEVILGAFMAGAILKLIDRDEAMTHPDFRVKLEAIGFGFFIPVFFIVSGIRLNVGALVARPQALALVPVLLVALLVVRGLPALLYAPLVGRQRTLAAALLQSTTLGFVVVAAQIGVELGQLSAATGAALVAAAVLSVLLFPLAALLVLRSTERQPAPAAQYQPAPAT